MISTKTITTGAGIRIFTWVGDGTHFTLGMTHGTIVAGTDGTIRGITAGGIHHGTGDMGGIAHGIIAGGIHHGIMVVGMIHGTMAMVTDTDTVGVITTDSMMDTIAA